MDRYDLRDGWTEAPLKEISFINPRHSRDINPETDVSFVPMPGVSDKSWKFNFTQTRKYSEVRKGYTHFEEDDILVAKITPCMENGKAAIAKGLNSGLGCGSTELHVIRPFKIVEPFYLFYFIKQETFRKEAQRNMTGTAGQLRVPVDFIKNVILPIPPINEQRRIVAKLDQLLAKVDAIQKRLDKIPGILKHFRQSVLTAACSGRLTEDWRYERKVCIEDWRSAVLGEVAELRLGKMLDKSKNIGNPTQYLRNINVRWFEFDLTDLFFMRATDKDKVEISIQDGDLLICEGGEPGRCAVWNQGKNNLIFQKALHRVRPFQDVSSCWLAINIKNDSDSRRLNEYFTGTTIKHLTGRSLSRYKFMLPSLVEQKEIVRRVEALFKVADQIEERYNTAKAHIDKLTQSILAKAFRGELVSQDPNDEPASELIKRIREERAKDQALPKQKRTRKRSKVQS
ncbi:MAG TPA: restriction endonuclease subunit S [Deltaproteobacteria bacterium]|nr:restriction endonuclease subunit S [Deltaproteobacteria bacterium]